MFVDLFVPSVQSGAQGIEHSDYKGGVVNHFAGRVFDAGLRRPYYDSNDRVCITVNTGRTTLVKGVQVPIRERRLIRDYILNGQISPTFNSTALRKEEWIELDKKVLFAARYRTTAWKDLAAANTYGGFNGMAKMMLEHETMSDPGEAVVDMDGLTDGRTDSPLFQLQGLPLPITHSDFWYDARRLAISRNIGDPLSTTSAEAAGRRIGELLEKTTIGVSTGITYGGGSATPTYGRTSSVYGYTNFTNRLTKINLTTPTGSNPEATVNDVLTMRDLLTANKFFGPWTIYHSNDWDKYMDNDYARLGGDNANMTLRQRLKAIGGVTDVKRLDMLFGSTTDANSHVIANLTTYGPGGDVDATLKPYTLIMVQMTPDVCRAVSGMDITTVQWESVGGMRLNFKVLCIQVPQIRADYYGNCGVLHATTS